MSRLFIFFVVAVFWEDSSHASFAVGTSVGPDVEGGVNLLQLNAGAGKRVWETDTESTPASFGGGMKRRSCPEEDAHKNPCPEDKKHLSCTGQAMENYKSKCTKVCSLHGQKWCFGTTFVTGDHEDKFPGDPSDCKENSERHGLFRIARASDNSWEVQAYSCGRFFSAAAMRFGNTTIQVVMPPWEQAEKKPDFWVNGVRTPHSDLSGGLPDGSFLGNHHRVQVSDSTQTTPRGKQALFSWGSCAGDSKGQVTVEISSNFHYMRGNMMNMFIEAAEGSMTTCTPDDDYMKIPESDPAYLLPPKCPGQDSTAMCNFQANHFRHIMEKVPTVPPEESLFTTSDSLCASCAHVWEDCHVNCVMAGSWTGSKASPMADKTCEKINQPNRPMDRPPFVAADAAGNAEAEADVPMPLCAVESDACDPDKTCCDAFREAPDGLNLKNIADNNLDGTGEGIRELRFITVLPEVDLSITSTTYSSRNGNAANKLHANSFAQLNVDVGTVQSFNFTFVRSGSYDPVVPGNIAMSLLDIDQGKKNKQRESVKVCGIGASPILTSNTELESTVNDRCFTVKSTTRGSRADYPTDPDRLSVIQSARAVAFPVKVSSFTVDLAISVGGRGTRNFLFNGHPTVACPLL